jgi:hypothetical protein
MKRVPRSSSEPQIVHLTTNTGDSQRFAISPENYDPEVIALMARMQTEQIQGYRLTVFRRIAEVEFLVIRDADGVGLSHNFVYLDEWPPFLQLETTILAQMATDEAAMRADLEQCAAIALTGIDPREHQGTSRGTG